MKKKVDGNIIRVFLNLYSKSNDLTSIILKFYNVIQFLLCYEASISIDKKYIDAYIGKGNTLYALRKNEEAIDAYNKAIEIYPQDTTIYDNKGYSLFLLGRISGVIESVCESIRIDENNANALYNRSIISFP